MPAQLPLTSGIPGVTLPTYPMYYFGCFRDMGHFVYDSKGNHCKYNVTPWGYSIDSGLAPKNIGQIQGIASINCQLPRVQAPRLVSDTILLSTHLAD
jgi:hypothetical protein